MAKDKDTDTAEAARRRATRARMARLRKESPFKKGAAQKASRTVVQPFSLRRTKASAGSGEEKATDMQIES